MLKKPAQLLSNLVTSDFQQKLRFAIVGGLNTVTAYLAFMAFYEMSGRYLVSSVLSYFVGMIVSYALNRTFVFKSEKKGGQFIPFCVVNLTSLACSTGSLYLLVHFGHLHVYIGQALAVCVSMGINYFGYKKVFTDGVSMDKLTQGFYDKNGRLDPLQVIQWLVVVVFAVVTVLNLHLAMSSNIAHDALPYMNGYAEKFTTEGRWINFALYYPLRAMPAVMAASLANIFLFIFAYKVVMGVKKDYWLAIAVALLIINIPSFTMLLKWPMTLLPGCFMLALFACYKESIHRSALLIVAGILLFATYPAFYFLIPLLFLSNLRNATYGEIFKFLCFWIIGYVAGYAVANGLVYLYTSMFTDHATFIHFVSWRQETPSNSLSSLLANIAKSAGNFDRNVDYFGALSPWLYIPIALTALWALVKHFKYTVIVLIVVISLYASVVPLGVKVPLRSGVTFPIGMAVLLMLIPNKWWRLLTLLTLFIPFSYQMHAYNYSYAHSRDVMSQILEQHDGRNYLKQPALFDKVVVSVDEEKMSKYMLDRTQSTSFNIESNLRYHYIKPFFYQYGWKNDNIEVINDPRLTVKGDATIKKEGRVLFISLD
ncbi:GtrA family protein [Vibrio algicola]|uniref:GtrA family protein n=1 Tax=Vibrio algicola TaxID=2662262 RepID=A0A5Q0TB17_9VIBR|nr:GtrA family protein [Vibrio algicola]